MLTTELVESILETIPGRTIGLLGDLFLDRYLDIDPTLDEPSIETGLTAYQVVGVRSYPGALGTVLNNLAALGVGSIFPISIIGDDGEGFEVRQALQKISSCELKGIISAEERRTPTYIKPMVLQPGQLSRELNRLDIKNQTPTPKWRQDSILQVLEEVWPRLDALIVLDQVSEEDCGVVTRSIREHLSELAQRDPKKFVLADSRERIGLFRHVSLKPNAAELNKGLGPQQLLDHSRRMLFSTAGEHGMSIFTGLDERGDLATIHVPAYPVTGPIDICGAGDSCSAGITCAMVSGSTPEAAGAFGNLVASITVQQIGVTGTATPEMVRTRWREVSR